MKTSQFLKTAVTAAQKGGKIIRTAFWKQKEIVFKGFANPVTETDKASEQAIVDTILKAFPSHSILTEEELTTDSGSTIKWVIDPLDGTVNFTHQIPFICVSIGVEADGEVVAGVIYNPILDELYTAEKGGGAWFNRKRIAVSGIQEPGKSLLVTGFPYEREGRQDYLMGPVRLMNEKYQGFRRLGAAAVDLVYVARGSFEAFYEESLKPWDTAAGKVLVEEAGGKLTNYRGEPYSIYDKTIVASNGVSHEGVQAMVREIPDPVW